jgi:mevalonate kinase
MKILAPGKLILSGEHSVVYGKPALAMAINRYVSAKVISQLSPFVSFDLSDLSYEHRFRFSTLYQLKQRIKSKYERFINGEFKIREVLQKPVELAQFAFMVFFDALNIKLNQGVKIQVQSAIPMGCGMGSSAATVLSILHAIARHLEVPLPSETFLRLGLIAENMQHGYSSGLDLQVSLRGGCLYHKDKEIFSRSIPQVNFYLVNTGSPITTTGECVTEVAAGFKSSLIWDEFAAVTHLLDAALQKNQSAQINSMLQENHRLLTVIGVVPDSIKQFANEVQLAGGAAKICGAGATRGQQAGAVLVTIEDEAHLKLLCDKYRYTILPVAGEARGVHVA